MAPGRAEQGALRIAAAHVAFEHLVRVRGENDMLPRRTCAHAHLAYDALAFVVDDDAFFIAAEGARRADLLTARFFALQTHDGHGDCRMLVGEDADVR